MKQIKRISITAAIVLIALGTISTVYAQGQRAPKGQGKMEMPQIDSEKVVKEQMEWFAANFDLNDDQTKLIKEIHTNDAEMKKEVMKSGLTPRDSDFREQMEGIDTKKEAELEEVLTKEQWQAFTEKKEEYMKIGRPERPQRRGKNG
ncbi:MAG: hypothetical protein BalsKO_09270 [Balneolaceae bacterium]